MTFENSDNNSASGYRQSAEQHSAFYDEELQNDVQDDNSSGHGKKSVVPDIVANRFNWGACLLSWIWGIGNKTYITLLVFVAALIPFIGIFAVIGMQVWFGLKGNRWAWQNKRFQSIEHCHHNQKIWAIVGACLTTIAVLIQIIVLVTSLFVLTLDNSKVKNGAITMKELSAVTQVLIMNEAMEQKCELSSKGIAECFEKQMNVSYRNDNIIDAAIIIISTTINAVGVL